jgi:hypothetical protein
VAVRRLHGPSSAGCIAYSSVLQGSGFGISHRHEKAVIRCFAFVNTIKKMSNQHHPKHRQQQQYQPAASMIEGTTTSTSTPAMRPTLRRATYVHVSDLTSAYNIDHAKLEQELSRVNTERKSREASLVGGGRLGTTSRANTVNNFTVSSEQQHPSSLTAKAEAAAVVEDLENELTAPVSAQKRLQPPRGGFNLCV